MGKHQINKGYLNAAEIMMRQNGSKFVITLALAPDGTVDCMKNIENVTEEEFRHTMKWFLKKYWEYKKDVSDDILKDLGLDK